MWQTYILLRVHKRMKRAHNQMKRTHNRMKRARIKSDRGTNLFCA